MASNVGQKAYEIFLFFGGGKQQQLHSIICSSDSSRSLGFVSVKSLHNRKQKLSLAQKPFPVLQWSRFLINQD